VRATRRGRFDVRYYYDHLDRLATRKDNYGNVTQFFYTNHQRPNEVCPKIHTSKCTFSILLMPELYSVLCTLCKKCVGVWCVCDYVRTCDSFCVHVCVYLHKTFI